MRKIAARIRKNENQYITEAIDLYNQLYLRKMLSQNLVKESRIVAANSMKVLAEFEKLTTDY